jgi:hypothetical protein
LTFFTVVALVAFGGEVLKSFSWCLFIGIIIGTYSSIYIASPFMLWWEGPVKNWWKKRKGETTAVGSASPSAPPAANQASSAAQPTVTANSGNVVRTAKKKKKPRPASAR